MAQIKDVLVIESKRDTLEQCVIIHLFEEGSFYRAYQWSAWLCHRYIKEFKPTHRRLKQDDETLIFVGFPVSSLMNYVNSDYQLITIAEKQIDILLPLTSLGEDKTKEEVEKDYLFWKESVPKTELNKKKEEKLLQYSDVGKITAEELLNEIVCFPIEQKTILESIAFLSRLKQKATLIITKT